ncbi:MAG: formylglycine-generating enzyme family protein [Polyangiales bacterium]
MLDGSTQNADCCESIPVPGGAFPMGRSLTGKNVCPADQTPQCAIDELGGDALITLSPYALDRFEVTVGRFRKFVDSWDYLPPPVGAAGDALVSGAGWQSAWNDSLPKSKADFERSLLCDPGAATWTSVPAWYENLPINCVSWFEAFAFCAWDGGRLPTEAEWEFAAANGANADLYPWGEATPSSALAVYACSVDTAPCTVDPEFPETVGSRAKGANTWGHRDLAGNVREWTLDGYSYYWGEARTNPADVTNGFRVGRGGFWGQLAAELRAASRGEDKPGAVSSGSGIRCARAQ